MRFLRGKWFMAACVLAVIVGIEIGGAGVIGRFWEPQWFSRTVVRAIRSGDPLPPFRLTAAEVKERDARLRTAFGETVPKTRAIAFALAANHLLIRNNGACEAAVRRNAAHEGACDLVTLSAAARVLLSESDPKVESLFVPGKWRLRHTPYIFFFLGKDGRAKIVVWAHEGGLLKSVQAFGARRTTQLREVSERSVVMLGDDPGPDEAPDASLSFLAISLDGREEDLGRIEVDSNLAQRFRYYAALQGKPYNRDDWMPPKQ
jgi:hypothetical protein